MASASEQTTRIKPCCCRHLCTTDCRRGAWHAYQDEGRRLSAYQPAMMVRLLLYGYCLGVLGSREMERATHLDVACGLAGLSVQALQSSEGAAGE